VTILVGILCFAISACVESQPAVSKPTVYEWIDTGPYPSSQRLAHDKFTCFQDAERSESRSMSDRWKAHLKLCMQSKGWGQKALD
jgi:hypothetical protein